jgi:PleD family two-component response regulator
MAHTGYTEGKGSGDSRVALFGCVKLSSQPNNSTFAVPVVDDEANIRKMLSLCLETEGHRVTAVGTPEDALAEISRRSFDVKGFPPPVFPPEGGQ